MSHLQRRPGTRLTRRERERRAHRLTIATGALGVVAVVGLVLALAFDAIGAGIPLIAAVLAVVCFVLLRQTLGR